MAIGGYLFVVLVYLSLSYSMPVSSYPIEMAYWFVAVLVGCSVGRVGIGGLLVLFLILGVGFPIFVLHQIASHSGLEPPLQRALHGFDWMQVLLELASVITSYSLFRLADKYFGWKRAREE